MSVCIRKAGAVDAAMLAGIIRDSFRDVALQFHLTPENCPTHPSNCTVGWVDSDLDKGKTYFIAEAATPVGCVALDVNSREAGQLQRLAVLPAHRSQGIGGVLVEAVEQEARSLGLQRLELGIIAENHRLREWYLRHGFVPGQTVRLEHLPFGVQYLIKSVGYAN